VNPFRFSSGPDPLRLVSHEPEIGHGLDDLLAPVRSRASDIGRFFVKKVVREKDEDGENQNETEKDEWESESEADRRNCLYRTIAVASERRCRHVVTVEHETPFV
jgi:hypothetical protein